MWWSWVNKTWSKIQGVLQRVGNNSYKWETNLLQGIAKVPEKKEWISKTNKQQKKRDSTQLNIKMHTKNFFVESIQYNKNLSKPD